MGVRILYYVQNIWPFSAFKYDDLKVSNALVRKLSIPEHTKQFVYAIPDQESGSVIYILCAQNLSERSDLDVECVIRGIRPEAVIAQVGDVAVNEILRDKGDECGKDTKIDVRVPSSYMELLKRFVVHGIKKEVGDCVPTSSFEVLRRCFVYKIGRERYEDMAGSLVLKEIFGVGFYGHFLTAKRVAEEVGSSFLLLESLILKPGDVGSSSGKGESGNKFQVLGFQPSSLVSQKAGSTIPSSSRGFGLANDLYLKLVKSLSAQVVPPNSSEVGTSSIQPQADYVAPQFAQSIYPLLVDLHNIFADIPSIGRGLAHAQKMLYNVYRGESVDFHLLSEVYIFRIAVEGLRIALNNAGRLPINEIRDQSSVETEFSDLPIEDKSHALLAHALKSQGKKFNSVVAIVDVSGLSGLRKHWNTPVPPEVKDMVEKLVTDCRNGESAHNEKRRLLTDKPVVAVGAGATAVLGASSLSKVVPASTFMKLVPTSLKLMITLPQKAFAIGLSKTLGPSKIVAPGLASKTSVLKATASTEKIRAVAHSLIASAEKTSLSAMRSAFYEIMRKRHVKPVGLLPWITFGGSVAMCTSLLICGDGIECAVESVPAAHSIANLGRGIQNLHEAAQSAGKMESSRIQKSVESILSKFKR